MCAKKAAHKAKLIWQVHIVRYVVMLCTVMANKKSFKQLNTVYCYLNSLDN